MTVHRSELVERHTVMRAVPDPLPDPETLLRLRASTWSELAEVAESWAHVNDVTVEVTPFERVDPNGTPLTWGVKFNVTVGRGRETVGRDFDDHPVFTIPDWTWSDRWRDWYNRFSAMDKPELSLLQGGKVLQFPDGGRR